MNSSADELIGRLRKLREQYREAHRHGMEALERRDTDALGKVIQEERRILDEQTRLIEDFRRLHPPQKRPEDSVSTEGGGESDPDRTGT